MFTFRLSRRRRRTTSFLVVVALLFSQLALASYVCPNDSAALATARPMPAGHPCDGMDADQPALCHQHAAGTTPSVDNAKVATPTLPMLVQVIEVPPLPPAARARTIPASARPQSHHPPDPIFLSTLRLRV